MRSEEVDLEGIIGDLQVEVGALQQMVELLLAQHALKSDRPLRTLEALKTVLETATTVVSTSADTPEGVDYSERVFEQKIRLINQAAMFVHAISPESN